MRGELLNYGSVMGVEFSSVVGDNGGVMDNSELDDPG